MAPKRIFFLQDFLFTMQKPDMQHRHLKGQDLSNVHQSLEVSVDVSWSCMWLPGGGRAIGLAFVSILAAKQAADGGCPTGPLH